MISGKTIKSKIMLDARTSARFVQTAGRFAAHIYIGNGSNTVNAKSIMGVIAIRVAVGDELTIRAEGDDADEAIVILEKFLSGNVE